MLETLDTPAKNYNNNTMTDPDNSNEPEYYEEEHELGHTPRADDDFQENSSDSYLDASYEDRFDMGDSYEQ